MNAKNIGYWITTVLFSLAILGSGLGKLTGQEPLVEAMTHLGYPLYLMKILGLWYLGGAIALLVPGLPRLKEWAYAGMAFALSGAFVSHLAAGDALAVSMPPAVLLGLALASWALRPDNRKLGGSETISPVLGAPVAAK